jgi:hypothetical protein
VTTAALDRLIEKYPECRDRDVCASIDTLEFYLNRRAEGMGHNFAAMLATQRFPGTKTEGMYFEGRHTLADQFKGNDAQLEAIVAAARARGYNPGVHDVYEPGLADDIGDPMAFIKPCGGTTELRKKLEATGRSCEGLIKVKGRAPRGPGKAAALAPDIVQEIAMRKAAENPDVMRMNPRELVEQINHEHGYRDETRAGAFTNPLTSAPEVAVQTSKPVTAKARQLAKGKKK